MMEDFAEYRKRVLKIGQKRKRTIRGLWGMLDAYNWVRDNGWPEIGEKMPITKFRRIVTAMNRAYAEELAHGRGFMVPFRIGRIVCEKFVPEPKMKNGKLHTGRCVDWNATLKLWHEDEEARKNKTLVRVDYKELSYIALHRPTYMMRNLQFLRFKPLQSAVFEMRRRFMNGEFDLPEVAKAIR